MLGKDVTAEFVVDDGAGRGRVTVLQLCWRACDPLAVSMSLVSRPEHPALPQGSWVAPRDALRTGLNQVIGDGDVRIGPDPGHRGVRLDLVDGDRRSVVVVSTTSLRQFLDRTERLVPTGQEHTEQELDSVLATLLET
ncbi:SsgA family sporulation/cell division regulator [Frankia sp. AgKG'84/4]|uniref:SsgA family sporulation/cell division regulator n=1 Tax=Frankia sp. AgKG'84/4 TaxID=573490 RepID=UPI00200DD048|nr:SsgA family sporulation/cell division regulator [Frankia sp. AgKG'84/4]MCL9797864.1 SsgA family sporulation/cell division regulator [Frankia sp. AgKG'84/4]